MLEQKKVDGGYRWTTVEPKRIAFGQMNPTEFDEAVAKHRKIAELVPYFLSTSPLDCDSFNVTFGFDFAYTGNHNAIVAEALGGGHRRSRKYLNFLAPFRSITSHPCNSP